MLMPPPRYLLHNELLHDECKNNFLSFFIMLWFDDSDMQNGVWYRVDNEKCSIKVKKKCTQKWRWPSRELKTWYMYNYIMGFLFTKKYFSYFDLYSWYGHFNVRFWQFWQWPNVLKISSEIVLCLFFLLLKNFYSR